MARSTPLQEALKGPSEQEAERRLLLDMVL
jgi:hypothetical protein